MMTPKFYRLMSMFLQVVCFFVVLVGEMRAGEGDKPAYVILDPHASRPVIAQRDPVPEFRNAPVEPKKYWKTPTIHSTIRNGCEKIALANGESSVELVIDSKRRVRITGIRTRSGHELLSAPASCMVLVDNQGTTTKDGATFTVDSWLPRQHSLYSEAELRLSSPETVIWRVRLYRDSPRIEQQFIVPNEWRATGQTVAQALSTVDSLVPVMPNNVFSRGFSNGRPNLKGRHRFEFVSQSDHLCYDKEGKFGLAAFVAGIGGEERLRPEQLALLDHAIPVLKSEPVGRFILWPFEGSVDQGFARLKQFIRKEYSCQRGKNLYYSWNQFWLWQGGVKPADASVVSAQRLLDVLPHVAALGCEEFHLDMGWQSHLEECRFDPKRFPDGFEPLRKFLRATGMRYHTWMGSTIADDPAVIGRLIETTDLAKIFLDRVVDEKTAVSMREVRRRYPDFETFVHHTTSRSGYYPWGNIHFLCDINQIYFGEGEFWLWSNVLPEKPEGDVNKRFFSRHSLRAGDLVTRSAAYQVHWAWPYTTIVPPHCGWAWFEDRPLDELASRMFTTLAARADYQWGEDPRRLRPEVLVFFMDWTAFFKTAKPYLLEYQHVLPVPDGIHPDGAAHLADGRGFIVLCNPGESEAEVAWKDLLWEPELELDPECPVKLSDWTAPVAPAELQTIDLAEPSGSIALKPLSYRVIGVNIDIPTFLADLQQARAHLHGPK
jgi:hypothetical protein